MSGRPLCTDVAEDGLRCDGTFPHCVHSLECVESGCFWRQWHGPFPDDRMMPNAPPRNADLLK